MTTSQTTTRELANTATMSSSVNKPTDTKVKEKDVNAKLQLYGIYAGTSPLPAVRSIKH